MGAKQGAPVSYNWTPAGILHKIAPWLLLLGLLALPQNRTLRAWWIWAPVGWSVALQTLLRSGAHLLSGQPIEVFAGSISALSFGFASLWLISGTRERASRFKTFLLVMLVVAGLGIGAYLLRIFGDGSAEAVPELIILLMCALIIPSSFSMAGLLCRRQYRPLRLVVWSLVFAVVFSWLLVAPLLLFALLSYPGNFLWNEFVVGVSLLVGASFCILLPFLVLAFSNTLFRARLKSLLQFAEAEPAVLRPRCPVEVEAL